MLPYSIVLLCQSKEVYKILKETGIGDFAFIVLVNMHKNPVMHQARKACSLGSIKKCLQKPKAAFSYSKIFK